MTHTREDQRFPTAILIRNDCEYYCLFEGGHMESGLLGGIESDVPTSPFERC